MAGVLTGAMIHGAEKGQYIGPALCDRLAYVPLQTAGGFGSEVADWSRRLVGYLLLLCQLYTALG